MGRANPITVYIVVEQGYEYNDEIHYPAGDGSPGRTFANKADAERVANESVANILEQQPLSDFCYALYERITYEFTKNCDDEEARETEATTEIRNILGDPDWTYERVMTAVSPEQLEKLKQVVDIQFAWVEERVIE